MGDYDRISRSEKCVVRRNSINNFNSMGKPENILSDILGRRATNFDRPLNVYVGHVGTHNPAQNTHDRSGMFLGHWLART